MAVLILLRGLPGAGKTSLAQELGWPYFEADQFFTNEDGVYSFDATQLPEAHAWCFEEATKALSKGINVIVSNTSTRESEVNKYQRYCEDQGHTFYSLIVENRHFGASEHPVPLQKIQEMEARFHIMLRPL